MSDQTARPRPPEPVELLDVQTATRAAAAAAGRWIERYRFEAGTTLSEPHLDVLLSGALETIAHLLNADAASLLIASDDGTELVARAAFGLDTELDLAVAIPTGAGASGPILSTGKPRLIRDLTKVDVVSEVLISSGQRSYVGVPLTSNSRVFGVLHATRREVAEFHEDDVELLMRFAEPIGAAIERVRLLEDERTARETAERMTERVRALQKVTAALANAESIVEICRIIVHEAVPAAIEGGEGAIWLLSEARLVLVAGLGLSADYPEIPLDPSLPAAENLEDGTALFVETREELSRRWPVLADGDTSAFAGLPLISEGKRLGVMAVAFRVDRQFRADEREFLSTIAEQAALALARADARAELNEAREIAEVRREQLAFLADASKRLSASLDIEVTLQTVAELGVPRLTDRCAIFLVEGETISKRALAPELNDDERLLFEESDATLSSDSGAGAVIRTGRAEYFEHVDESMLASGAESEERLALLKRVGFGGLLILPLRARGRNLGALAFVNRAGRPLTEVDRALAEELSARAAVAIDNALLYRDESYVAHELARSLLPSRLPRVDGLDIAVQYSTGSAGLNVGGDFYDVFELEDGQIVVLIGDVQGKGVEAAAITGLTRYTVRACAQYQSSPAALLEQLNIAIARNIFESAANRDRPWSSARLCTAAIMRLDRSAGDWMATVSCAGHPSPLLRQPDGSVVAIGESALLLGCREDSRYHNSTVALAPDSVVVMFTDGVSERYAEADILGGDGIAEILKKAEGSSKQITRHIMTTALGHDAPHDDDKVVLTVRIESSA